MGMDPLTIGLTLSAISTGVDVISSISNGNAQKQNAEDNAEIARRNAAQEKDAAVAQAEKIRIAAKRQQSAANAGLAASGVDLNSGSAVKINDFINLNSEQDAYTTILTGTRGAQASLNQASMFSRQGSNAQSAGFLNAGSSLLAGGAAIGSGWKTGGTGSVVGSGFKANGSVLYP